MNDVPGAAPDGAQVARAYGSDVEFTGVPGNDSTENMQAFVDDSG